MIEIYYTDPLEWDNNKITLPFYLLITDKHYQIFWDGNSKRNFDFITSMFNKQFELINSYEIFKGERRERWPYNYDQEHIEYILENIHKAHKINPEQLLTHHNPHIRNIIKAELSND